MFNKLYSYRNDLYSYCSNLQLFILFQGLFGAFAGSYVLVYFYNHGFPLYLLPLTYALTSGFSLIIISLFKIDYKASMVVGISSYMLSYASLLLPINYSYLLYVLFYSFGIHFFWVTYNYLYFRNIKSGNAVNSSFYSFIPAVSAAIILPFGGYLIKSVGYQYVFGITALLHLIPVILTLRLIKSEPEEMTLSTPYNINPLLNFKKMFKDYQKLRTITFFEGAIQFFPLAILNVYTLLFFHEETKYGLFLGYLGLLGAFASIGVSSYSDHKKERLHLLLVPFILMCLTIFLLSLAKTQLLWIILVTVTMVLLVVTYPLRLALSLDHKDLDYTFWRAREFFLNTGRMVTLSLSSLFFYLKLYWLVFALFGTIVLLYPLVARYKLKELEKIREKTR